MNHTTVYVNPVGPSHIGWSQAAGLPGDARIDFKTPGNLAYSQIASMYPQLVIRPFTNYMAHAYDVDINDPTGGSGIVTIPGSVMNDRFHIELYERNDVGQPQRMLAVGMIDITGYAYVTSSPLSPASYSIGPAGPAGPQGPRGVEGAVGGPGVRGSRWYTGSGPPTGYVPDDRVDGDMWLDEGTGDVWRWNASAAAWALFKGV